jgi:hypothetical protein
MKIRQLAPISLLLFRQFRCKTAYIVFYFFEQNLSFGNSTDCTPHIISIENTMTYGTSWMLAGTVQTMFVAFVTLTAHDRPLVIARCRTEVAQVYLYRRNKPRSYNSSLSIHNKPDRRKNRIFHHNLIWFHSQSSCCS